MLFLVLFSIVTAYSTCDKNNYPYAGKDIVIPIKMVLDSRYTPLRGFIFILLNLASEWIHQDY